MSEKSEVQDIIFEYLVRNRWLVIRINGGKRGRLSFYFWQCLGYMMRSVGVSDLIGCTDTGRFFAIECKAPGKSADVKPAQAEFLEAVRERGGLAMVADDIEKVIRITK